MSELGDYKRMIEKPMINRFNATITAQRAEIERLRKALEWALSCFECDGNEYRATCIRNSLNQQQTSRSEK